MLLSKTYPSVNAVIAAMTALQHHAKQSRQRRLVVLSGERAWSVEIAQQFCVLQPFAENFLWVSDQLPVKQNGIEAQQAKKFLGQELALLVFDAWAGLDPNALAALTGTIVAGGLLILLIPAKRDWPNYHDPDYQRILVHGYQLGDIKGRLVKQLLASIETAQSSLWVQQGQPVPVVSEKVIHADVAAVNDGFCVTEDQAKAVVAIKRVLTGRNRRPLVIKADRGRGKSSALGIASAELMQQSLCHIVVTAPRVDAVQAVFERAAQCMTVDPATELSLRYQHANTDHSSLRFIAVDELLRYHYNIDLLLVDEAAAIPAVMLEQLLSRYPRIVFSTTVHGYEGTGRGFDLRFKNTLDQLAPQWKTLLLTTPIRWAENDPVERWLFDALLLDAVAEDIQADKVQVEKVQVEKVQTEKVQVNQCVIEKIARDQLITEPQTLRQIFGLLIAAHYQTTPADLRVLLDGPNIVVWVSRCQGQIIAAALVAQEGGFDADLALAIWRGERRPRGHLIPQTLAAHSGYQAAPKLRYQRIVRIAVHPQAQRQHVGGQLMAEIVAAAREHCDFIGSSFAASPDVMAFWRSVGCVPVKLGVSRDASSGCYSAVVLSALSSSATQLLATMSQRFAAQWPLSLANLYHRLETDLVADIFLSIDSAALAQLDQQDYVDIEAFAEGFRQYEMCWQPLWKLVCLELSRQSSPLQQQPTFKALLISRVLQQQSLEGTVKRFGYTGKKQLLADLRRAIKLLVAIA